jgi:regulator of protease activity HflC (stomatin/prohibitin superfamily)
MSSITQTTFETTFTRADVRQHLRNKCANTFLKKMTDEEKKNIYDNASITVNTDGVQVGRTDFKNADWIREIIASWNRVEDNHIPVSAMETIIMKPEAIDALNQKFEAKEVAASEKKAAAESAKAEKKAAAEAAKADKKAVAEAVKAEKKAEKKLNASKAKLAIIDPDAVLNTEGLVIVDNVVFGNDNSDDMAITMTIKDYAKAFKSHKKLLVKEIAQAVKTNAKIAAAAEKFEAKEAAKADKKAQAQAAKAEKKAQAEAAKAEKKARKSTIKETVKHLTDSDKRILIADNATWLADNDRTAASVEESLALITSKDYHKLLSECDGELSKMSWYQHNVTEE